MNQSTNDPTPTATEEKKDGRHCSLRLDLKSDAKLEKSEGQVGHVPTQALYPQIGKDPQIGPKMIPSPKSSPYFFLLTPKRSPRN